MIELQSCRDPNESGLLSVSPPICGKPSDDHCLNNQTVATDMQTSDAMWHWECIEPTSYACPSNALVFNDSNWYHWGGPGKFLLANRGSVSIEAMDTNGGLPENSFLPIMVLKCINGTRLPTKAPTSTTTPAAATRPTTKPGAPTAVNYKHKWKVAESQVVQTGLIVLGAAVGVVGVAGVLMVHYGVIQLPHTTTASGVSYQTLPKDKIGGTSMPSTQIKQTIL
jgi:hypothetical protein